MHVYLLFLLIIWYYTKINHRILLTYIEGRRRIKLLTKWGKSSTWSSRNPHHHPSSQGISRASKSKSRVVITTLTSMCWEWWSQTEHNKKGHASKVHIHKSICPSVLLSLDLLHLNVFKLVDQFFGLQLVLQHLWLYALNSPWNFLIATSYESQYTWTYVGPTSLTIWSPLARPCTQPPTGNKGRTLGCST